MYLTSNRFIYWYSPMYVIDSKSQSQSRNGERPKNVLHVTFNTGRLNKYLLTSIFLIENLHVTSCFETKNMLWWTLFCTHFECQTVRVHYLHISFKPEYLNPSGISQMNDSACVNFSFCILKLNIWIWTVDFRKTHICSARYTLHTPWRRFVILVFI